MAARTAVEELVPGVEVVDAHAHIGRWNAPGGDGSADDLRRLLDRTGFSKVIVSSALAITYDVPGGNAEVARAAESDGRIYGSVTFNAHYPAEARAEIARYAGHPRFVCAKIHPGHMNAPVDHPNNMGLYGLLAERRLPLTVHTWTGDARKLRKAARRFPELGFVWFHALATDYRRAAELAAGLPNVYLDFVTSVQERGKVEELVRLAGSDKLLFGTDQTLIDPVYALGPVLEAKISEEDRRRILGGNALGFFDFNKA